MIDLEMRLGEEIAKAVEKDNMVVFRNDNTKQPYALFKLKDEAGAVIETAKGLYLVTTKDFEDDGKELGR